MRDIINVTEDIEMMRVMALALVDALDELGNVNEEFRSAVSGLRNVE